MAKKSEKKLIVALDIGTTKIVVLIGEIAPDGEIEIIGVGTQPSSGLKRGVVVNIESTVHSIQRAVEEAELMAGCQVHSAYTGVAGSHIHSLNSNGIVAIRSNEVTQVDIDRVIDAARAVAIPADRKIIHILPQEFIIDSQSGIREPVGMSGVRLESKVHIVTGLVSAAQNIIKCVRRCGIVASDIILEQLASSYAVLSEDEKDLGVCMVDIGGGTTDIAVYYDGAIRHTAVIPIAGDQVTNDVAVAFRMPTQDAEKIKIKHGCAFKELADPAAKFDVNSLGEKQSRIISEDELADVLEPRYEELFTLIQAELRRAGVEDMISSGIVFTGGAVKVKGGVALAEKVFSMPVRVGAPTNITGPKEVTSNPIYATSVGLILYGYQQQEEGRPELFMGEAVKGVWGKMRTWLQGNF